LEAPGNAGDLVAGSLTAEPEAVDPEESGTIENAGSPVHNQSETAGTEEHTGE
jgi:hypothetical protein